MQSPSNNRSSSRFLTLFELKVRNSNSGESLGLLVDASRNGLCLVSPQSLPAGTEFELEIESSCNSDHSSHGEPPIRGTAVVRWCRSNGVSSDLNVIGMEFVQFDTSESEQAFMTLISRDCVAVWDTSGLAVPTALNE